ncbi:MAG: transporter substrate-binding domain-containing protein [Helicobacteraceae bacterium]|nr:transporter substrate-binding domain-containing protein [Helicobacteraceae bacterium]
MKRILLIVLLYTSLFANDVIKIYTEHYPPYNMKNKDGKLVGSSIEVLDAVLKKMNSSQSVKDVKLRSWAKSYAIAQKIDNAMVFSTTKTSTREPLFKWVGPIATATVGVIALKSKKINIKKVSDFNKYKIGAVLKDIGETLLLEAGVSKNSIQYVKGEDAINISFNKMKKNRIDMFVYNINVALANAKMEGFDVNKYEIVYTLKVGYQYFAFKKNTDDKIIKKWQSALDAIKKDGTYDKIHSKY